MTAVSVTAEHIAAGIPEDCGDCPVALAIGDVFPGATYIRVTGIYVLMRFTGHELEHELPAEVQRFTWNFDTGQSVEPFSFELDYPAVTS